MEETREYGLTRGTCFVARRLEVVAVAGRLFFFFRGVFFVFSGISCFFLVFFLLRTHTAYCRYEQYLASCTSLLVPGCVQGAIIYMYV